MKSVCLALFILSLTVRAEAAEFPLALDGGKPAASITLPDDWKPRDGAHGVEGTSPDGLLFLVAKIIKPDEQAAANYNDETTAYFEEQGVAFSAVKEDADPKTTDTDTKINGLDTFVSRLDEATAFKGAPTVVTYYAIPLGETQTLNIVTRGPSGDQKLPAIVATVKALP
ncbi:MAG: hypothetical protein ABSA13_11295 [Beijerinckiaceae bacterium]